MFFKRVFLKRQTRGKGFNLKFKNRVDLVQARSPKRVGEWSRNFKGGGLKMGKRSMDKRLGDATAINDVSKYFNVVVLIASESLSLCSIPPPFKLISGKIAEAVASCPSWACFENLWDGRLQSANQETQTVLFEE